MNKINELKPVQLVTLPEWEKMEHGILYVSKEYGVANHLCACGCGNQTVTPIDKVHGWVYSETDGKVTLRPSIGNYQIPCKSHYYITDNKIQWL